ncbi:MAG: outer membrane protein [Bauldia sp.]
MKHRKTLLAVTAGTAVLASAGAFAADVGPIVVPEAPAPAPAPIVEPAGFDWSGFYLGALGGYRIGPSDWSIAGQAGYNFVAGGNLLFGVEARAGVTGLGGDGTEFAAMIGGRAGFIAGDRLLLYAATGLGYRPSEPQWSWNVGGGAEFALGQNLSIFGEARYARPFGEGEGGTQINVGLNWHL